MSVKLLFDPVAIASGWFDETGTPPGWFDIDLGEIADGPVDDSIAVQMTATFADASYGDEVEEAGLLYEGATCSPLEDAPPDATITVKHFVDPIWIVDEDEWTPDWAQAPPKDVADETGETRGQVSLNDWIDEDEPVTDGWVSSPPDFEENAPLARLLGEVFDDDEPIVEFVTASPTAFPSDETGETIGGRSNNDWTDEYEPLADDWWQRGLAFPDDETGETTGQQHSDQWLDDDEPITDGSFASPLEETGADDDYTFPQPADVYDEDEPDVEFWTLAPLEDAPVAAVDDIISQESGPVWDDDEPSVEFWTASPLEDAPAAAVDDVGPQESGQVWDEDEPVSDGTFGTPVEETAVDDDYALPLLGEVVDEDEPVTDGTFATPLEETATDDDINAVSFPADDDLEDEYPQAYADGFTGSPLEDAPAAPQPPVEEDSGKGGWDPHWYKPRRKKAKKREEVERFLAETVQIDAPEAIQETAEVARDAAQEYLALADTSLQREAQRLLAEALDRIDAFYEAVHAEADRRRAQDEEDDEDWLLLS